MSQAAVCACVPSSASCAHVLRGMHGVCSYATTVSDTLRRRTEGLQRCRLHATRRITGAPASMQEAPGCSDSLGLLRMHYGSQRHAHGNAHGCQRSEGPRTRQIGTHGAQPHSCSRTVNRIGSHRTLQLMTVRWTVLAFLCVSPGRTVSALVPAYLRLSS